MAKCLCGCGYRLSGQQKKYASKQCQSKYERGNRNVRKPQKYPFNGEMLTIREALEKHGSTVKIEAVYSRMKKGMTMYEAITQKKYSNGKERPEYITKYCHQGWSECAEYSECMGDEKTYTGSCFVKERMTSGVQGISSVCSVNL